MCRSRHNEKGPDMTDHRSFPDAADGRPMPPMGYTILEASKGLLDWEGAAELSRSLRYDGYYLVRASDLDWNDIRRFEGELAKGQSIHEDGGGYFIRAIMALFGKRPDPVENYQQAAERMLHDANLAE